MTRSRRRYSSSPAKLMLRGPRKPVPSIFSLVRPTDIFVQLMTRRFDDDSHLSFDSIAGCWNLRVDWPSDRGLQPRRLSGFDRARIYWGDYRSMAGGRPSLA